MGVFKEFDNANVYGISFTRDKLNDPEKTLLEGDSIVALYGGASFPTESLYFDKLSGEAKPTKIVMGSCVRVFLTKGTKVRSMFNGETMYRFSVRLRSFWNKEFKIHGFPAFYNLSVLCNCESVYHRVLSVYVNGEKFYAVDRFKKPEVDYLFKFLQSAINELVYLDGYSFEGKELVFKNANEYYNSEFRRTQLLFWLSHYSELFKEVVDSKPQEPSGTPKEVTHERSAEHKEQKPPVNDRTKMGVKGVPEAQIRIKNVSELADCVVTEKRYIVINFPRTHAHAFWVLRQEDYEHFIVVHKGKRMFDKSLEDNDHPIYRFYHTPGAYEKLKHFAF